MQFVSALVEHLVVGLVALIWLLPVGDQLSLIPNINVADYKEVLIAIGLPVAYVVGVYVDVIASIFASFIKRAIDCCCKKCRAKFFGAHLTSATGTSYQRTVIILKESPDEAARYLLQLCSREKISRGIFLNFFIAAVINWATPVCKYYVSPFILLVMFVVGVLVWLRLNALTDNFKSHWMPK